MDPAQLGEAARVEDQERPSIAEHGDPRQAADPVQRREQRLQQRPPDDELSKETGEALKSGNLNRAESLLKDLLAKEETQVDRTARNHFNLAALYELRFQPLQALSEYAKAYQYRPDEFRYAINYADLLHKQNRHGEAAPVYLAALGCVHCSAHYTPLLTRHVRVANEWLVHRFVFARCKSSLAMLREDV